MWAVVSLLWIINGNAHYHNRDKLLNKDSTDLWLLRTVGPCLYGFFSCPKQFISWLRKNLQELHLWLVDPAVWCLPN